MTATSIINEKELLLANLGILQVDFKGETEDKEVIYSFKDKNKNPNKVFKECDRGYKEVRKCLESAN
jgi:hypothetical protein